MFGVDSKYFGLLSVRDENSQYALSLLFYVAEQSEANLTSQLY